MAWASARSCDCVQMFRGSSIGFEIASRGSGRSLLLSVVCEACLHIADGRPPTSPPINRETFPFDLPFQCFVRRDRRTPQHLRSGKASSTVGNPPGIGRLRP